MRKANFPKDGYIFRHKTNTDAFARELYLAEGESLKYEGEDVTITRIIYSYKGFKDEGMMHAYLNNNSSYHNTTIGI